MKLQKFENVDVIASLEAIMKQNTAFYQSDFDIDKQILQKAAVSPIPEDKRLLWFSRPSGTCCFRERDEMCIRDRNLPHPPPSSRKNPKKKTAIPARCLP